MEQVCCQNGFDGSQNLLCVTKQESTATLEAMRGCKGHCKENQTVSPTEVLNKWTAGRLDLLMGRHEESQKQTSLLISGSMARSKHVANKQWIQIIETIIVP